MAELPPPEYDGYRAEAPGAPARTNPLAVASLVLAILWLFWLGSILAIVLGSVAKGQIDRSGGAQGGRDLAVAAIVLGWLGVALLALFIVAGVGVGSGSGVSDYLTRLF